MKMALFSNEADSSVNLLPCDGVVQYYGPVMQMPEANAYMGILMSEIEWRHDEAVIFGKRITTKRKVAWYGDAAYAYTYSKITRHALPWTEPLKELKAIAQQLTGEIFNSCLLNLYHSGEEGVAWHSDDELMLEKDGAIASMSFGAARKFSFRHKNTRETVSLLLEPGSLLLMKGETQTNWVHSLPKTTTVKTPRINLTFRKMAITT